MKLYCFIFLTILFCASCVPVPFEQQEKSELEFKDEEEERRRNPNSVISIGRRLWNQKCASCHTNTSNGLPAKLFASIDDINNGLENVETMSYLKNTLSESEISEIHNYLNNEAIEDARNNKSDGDASSTLTLGTRSFVISKLNTIYNESSSARITDIIKVIDNYPGSFGGTCSSQYGNCSGEVEENYNASMNTNINVIRKGAIIKACRELHSETAAVDNAISYCELDISLADKKRTIDKAIQCYSPGVRDNNKALQNNLFELYNNSISGELSNKDAWSVVLYSLCSTSTLDRI